ncbi:MAG: TonB family protein, partial [Planctomycetes bacterium]|nr:TonB family protein [Planctomycetota bacterium]
ETSSGHEILDRAAQRCVEGWRFLPATRDGVRVPDLVRIPIRFAKPR